MWKVIATMLDIRLILRCEMCGAKLPSIRDGGTSIQSFKWTCSEDCYLAYIDELVALASPVVDYSSGAFPGVELTLRVPTIRQQMHDALEKWELSAGEPE